MDGEVRREHLRHARRPLQAGQALACTRKGDTVYLHILAWPQDVLTLPPLPAKIVQTSLLTGGNAKVSQTDEGIEISVPKADRQPIDTIVVLRLDRPAIDIAPIAASSRGNSLTTGKKATASNVFQNNEAFSAKMAVDNDNATRWANR